MKDWRGVPVRISDRVVWAARRWDGDRRPQTGIVTRVNEEKGTVTVKRDQPAPTGKYETGYANLPVVHVTRVDELPLPRDEDECVGLDAI